jgi:para-nitrobenzyl esterase
MADAGASDGGTFTFFATFLLVQSIATAPIAVAGATADPSLVDLGDGAKVRGVVQPELGIKTFKGIPYAEPPVDALRWLPPVPKQSWTPTTRQAVSSAANCAQHIDKPAWDTLDVNGWPTEDCLYLDVFAPYNGAVGGGGSTGAAAGSTADGSSTSKSANSSSTSTSTSTTAGEAGLLPVMVYIFGGGYYAGGVKDSMLDPTGMVANAAHPTIVVKVNFRVGIFGQLGAEELRRVVAFC